MLQEILDSEDGPLFSHLGEQIALVKQQRLNRVKQFYPPIRTLHYTGKNQKNEVLVFHTEAIMRSGTDFNVTVDLASLVPELAALRVARVREDLQSPAAIIYTNRRTGRIDPSKIALAYRVHRHGDLVSAKADNGERHLFSGSAAEIAADLRAMRELGVEAVDFSFPADTADAVLASMRKFHNEVAAKAR